MQADTWRTAQRLAGIKDLPRPLSTNGNGANKNAEVGVSEPTIQRADFPFTDAGNAETFAQMFGSHVRWDKRRGHWLVWEAPCWRPDKSGEVQRMALECVRARQLRVLNEIDDDEKRKRALRFCLDSESLYRRTALLKSVSDFEPVVDIGDKWNENDWLLGCANGILDLHDGTLRDGTPDDRVTLITGVAFDPLAKCPRWYKYLEEMFVFPELIEYLKRAVGYSLTGDISEQVLFLLQGLGSNGKSVFLAILRALLGEYAANTPFSTFEFIDRNSATNDL